MTLAVDTRKSIEQMSRLVGKPTMWFLKRSHTNRAVQAQKMARDWKFWIKKVEELYYPCSENKGADQLRSYCEADLRLCFRICRLLVISCGGSNQTSCPTSHPIVGESFTELIRENKENSIGVLLL